MSTHILETREHGAPCQTTVRRGIEVERWAHLRGKPNEAVDVAQFMTHLSRVDPALGRIVREPGLGSIEFAGHHADSVSQAVQNVAELHKAALNYGFGIVSSTRSPFNESARTSFAPKPRYVALWKALLEEVLACGGTEADAKTLDVMKCFAATHIHFSDTGMEISLETMDERMVFVTNVLNIVGPRVARILCKCYGLSNAGHLGIWSRWADRRRFSMYGRWFASFDHLRREFESLPRLVKCIGGDKEDGEWVVDRKQRLEWSDPDDDGAGWWLYARPRPRLGTLEVRLLPSMNDEVLPKIAEALDDFVCYLFSVAHRGVGFPDLDSFFASQLWREIARRPIGGGLPISAPYTISHWNGDVFE